MSNQELNFTDLSADIITSINEFVENHNAFVEKGNKSAALRARHAILRIKNATAQYRKLSVIEAKEVKKGKTE